MALITGSNGGDDIVGTTGDDIIDAIDGPDRIEDLDGADVIRPGRGDDLVILGPGRDIVEILPDGRDDEIYFFKSGEDTLMFNGFATLDTYAELEPFIRSDQEAAIIRIDVSAADGRESGAETLVFRDTFGFGEESVVFAKDRLEGGSGSDPIDPRVLLDPGDVPLIRDIPVIPVVPEPEPPCDLCIQKPFANPAVTPFADWLLV